MWLLDYEMKQEVYEHKYHILKLKTYLRACEPNLTFNCSFRDLVKVVCECGLQYTKAAKKQHERSKNHNLIIDAIRKHTMPILVAQQNE
jgi:hypothetical protein